MLLEALGELVGTLLAMHSTRLRQRDNLLSKEGALYCSAMVQHCYTAAGIDLLLEKPMCDRSSDARSLIAQAGEAGVLLGTGHNFLLYPIWDKLKAAPQLVTAPHAPVPFSPALEDIYIPSQARIEAAVRAAMGKGH